MIEIATLGLDIGKRVLQVHGADTRGKMVLQRKLNTFCHWAAGGQRGIVRFADLTCPRRSGPPVM